MTNAVGGTPTAPQCAFREERSTLAWVGRVFACARAGTSLGEVDCGRGVSPPSAAAFAAAVAANGDADDDDDNDDDDGHSATRTGGPIR